MNIESIVQSDIEDGIIDGAAVLSGDAERNLFEQGYGSAVRHGDIPMTTDTVIDIASVTKVLTVTTALLIARDRDLVDFDAPFTRYLPDFSAELFESIPTVRDLAAHSSGFGITPGEEQRAYFAESGPRILAEILRHPPVRRPRETVEYACWNFLLLGLIAERVTGESLVTFCQREIFAPLGMSDTSLGKPATSDPARLARTIQTRKPGEISDYIAFRVFRDGGSCGNAGAFSTARDLAKFCRCILKHGEYGDGKRLFSETMFQEITTPCTPASSDVVRGFGWVLDAPRIWHTGWSGQTILIDFGKQLFAVVLTNRQGEYERATLDRFKIIDALLSQESASR